MTGIKYLLLGKIGMFWCSLVAAAVVEPLTLPVVIVSSMVAGLFGGFTSAKRLGVKDIDTISTHMLSMAQLGVAISLLGYGWFGDDPTEGHKLIGLACMAALVGMPVIEPITEMSAAVVKAIAEKILGWIGHQKQPPNNES